MAKFNYDGIQINEELKNIIESYCTKIMSRAAGFDICGISFKPKFLLEDIKSKLENDLEKFLEVLS